MLRFDGAAMVVVMGSAVSGVRGGAGFVGKMNGGGGGETMSSGKRGLVGLTKLSACGGLVLGIEMEMGVGMGEGEGMNFILRDASGAVEKRAASKMRFWWGCRRVYWCGGWRWRWKWKWWVGE